MQSPGKHLASPAKEKVSSHNKGVRRVLLALLLGFAGLMLPACRTVTPLPPVNLTEPGWTMKTGQALYRSKTDAAEIAGELLVATHPDGRTFAQFTKSPFPLFIARTTGAEWQFEIVPAKRTFAGTKTPPPRWLLLHLSPALQGTPLPADLAFTREGQNWTLENRRTGERLGGFLK